VGCRLPSIAGHNGRGQGPHRFHEARGLRGAQSTPTTLKLGDRDFDNAGGDLEKKWNAIGDIADALVALWDGPPATVLEYLAERLCEHRDEAMGAFRRI
jgi:hypothetical protein